MQNHRNDTEWPQEAAEDQQCLCLCEVKSRTFHLSLLLVLLALGSISLQEESLAETGSVFVFWPE